MWPVYAGVIEARFVAHLSGADGELLAEVLSRVAGARPLSVDGDADYD